MKKKKYREFYFKKNLFSVHPRQSAFIFVGNYIWTTEYESISVVSKWKYIHYNLYEDKGNQDTSHVIRRTWCLCTEILHYELEQIIISMHNTYTGDTVSHIWHRINTWKWAALCAETHFNFCQTAFAAYASFIRLHCFGFPLVLASTEQVIMHNSLWLFSIWSLAVNPEAGSLQASEACEAALFVLWKSTPRTPGNSSNTPFMLGNFMFSSVNSPRWLFQEEISEKDKVATG